MGPAGTDAAVTPSAGAPAAVTVMILAAGLGARMRPLTDHTPKPLLRVAGVPLIEHHLRRLAAADLSDVVINVSHLGGQIEQYCGDGGRWGLSVRYSREAVPLETAGGILHARPLLGEAPFLVVNGDIWSDFPFGPLLEDPLRDGESARLVLVDNPPQHAAGDFSLDDGGWVGRKVRGDASYTYTGIGLYSWRLFAGLSPGKAPLRPLLDAAIDRGELGGIHYTGHWEDVGTPQRLRELDARLDAPG